jgi:hypothetical protein
MSTRGDSNRDPWRAAVVVAAGASLALIALMLSVIAGDGPFPLAPGPLAYFLGFGLPQAVILVGLRKSREPILLGIAGGVAGVMSLLCIAWGFLAFLMAWNFRGDRAADPYWTQGLVAVGLLVAQFVMAVSAYVSLHRSNPAGNAAARMLGGLGVAVMYLVVAFTVLRSLYLSQHILAR